MLGIWLNLFRMPSSILHEQREEVHQRRWLWWPILPGDYDPSWRSQSSELQALHQTGRQWAMLSLQRREQTDLHSMLLWLPHEQGQEVYQREALPSGHLLKVGGRWSYAGRKVGLLLSMQSCWGEREVCWMSRRKSPELYEVPGWVSHESAQKVY